MPAGIELQDGFFCASKGVRDKENEQGDE